MHLDAERRDAAHMKTFKEFEREDAYEDSDFDEDSDEYYEEYKALQRSCLEQIWDAAFADGHPAALAPNPIHGACCHFAEEAMLGRNIFSVTFNE